MLFSISIYMRCCIWSILLVFANRGRMLCVGLTSHSMASNKLPETGFPPSKIPFNRPVTNSPKLIIPFLPRLKAIYLLQFLSLSTTYFLQQIIFKKWHVSKKVYTLYFARFRTSSCMSRQVPNGT